MCLICLDYQLGKLTRVEARKALMEFISSENIETEHIMEVAQLIEDEEGEDEDEQV